MAKNPDRYFYPAVFCYEDGQEILSCERSGEGKMISDYLSRIHVL